MAIEQIKNISYLCLFEDHSRSFGELKTMKSTLTLTQSSKFHLASNDRTSFPKNEIFFDKMDTINIPSYKAPLILSLSSWKRVKTN